MRKVALFAVFSTLAGLAAAQNTPVAVTGFNYDGIADGPSANSSTTGTLDSIYDYFAVGFDAAAPTVGLSTTPFISASDPTTTFELAPAAGNNLLWLQQANSGFTTGTLTLVTPHAFTTLAFLVTGFNGNQPGGFSLNFSSGAPTTGGFTASDNFNVTPYALRGFGRVSRGDGLFDLAGGINPRMYQVSVTLSPADAARTLTSISFANSETSGVTFHDIGIFAISGSAVPEPASMIALGLGATALLRRRRR